MRIRIGLTPHEQIKMVNILNYYRDVEICQGKSTTMCETIRNKIHPAKPSIKISPEEAKFIAQAITNYRHGALENGKIEPDVDGLLRKIINVQSEMVR